jgi:hypothetical protein
MTPTQMTPAERLVASQLHSLADIPVTEHDVENAQDEFRSRRHALPSDAARRTRTRLLAAAAAVVLVAAAVAVWTSHQSDTSPEPASKLSHSDRVAIRTATGFVDAFHFFNPHQARRLLAPGATLGGAVTTQDWPATMRFFRETGGEISPRKCHILRRTRAETIVRCPYTYQLMRSGDLGLGPYAGSYFRITTRGQRITQVNMHHQTSTNSFHDQMWAPFAAWIETLHHRDGAEMYPDWPNQGHWPATDQAIRLWSQRTRQFVRFARHSCRSTHQSVFGGVCVGQQPGG